MPKKNSILFIVESPTKVKTLNKILNSKGNNYIFVATLGHIKELPPKSLGIELANFEPYLTVLPEKKKLLSKICKLLPKAKKIYLATDPDREGEAISVHLYEYLKDYLNSKGQNKPSNHIFKRIELHEITPYGLETAFQNERELDFNLYQSWKARRVLDRLIGYLVSPSLSRFFKKPLSAGRVQSPALKLIVEREREIENFIPQKSYSLLIYVISKNNEKFELTLFSSKNQLVKTQSKEELLDIYKKYFEEEEVILEKIKEKLLKKYPPHPFKTSTLIEASGKILGLSPKETMRIAQNLYEKGLITYMRTDSVRVSPVAKESAKIYIERIFGKDYVGEERKIKTKGIIQDAHECIRPTHISDFSPKIPLSGKERTLYELIFSHFIASQMKEALFKEISYQFRRKGIKGYLLLLKEKVLLFDGYMRVLGQSYKENQGFDLKEEDHFKVVGYEIKEHITEPPERYTPHSLIKKLEELGIGRPSTYPTILDILFKRNYVILEGKYLKPTPLGIAVSDYLSEKTKSYMEYNFTAEMEKALDEMCEGKRDYVSFLQEHYNLIREYLSR